MILGLLTHFRTVKSLCLKIYSKEVFGKILIDFFVKMCTFWIMVCEQCKYEKMINERRPRDALKRRVEKNGKNSLNHEINFE